MRYPKLVLPQAYSKRMNRYIVANHYGTLVVEFFQIEFFIKCSSSRTLVFHFSSYLVSSTVLSADKDSYCYVIFR